MKSKTKKPKEVKRAFVQADDLNDKDSSKSKKKK